MAKRDLKLIVFGILCGAMIGTLLGNVFMFLLPESAVKDFFLTSIFEFGFGSLDGTPIIDLEMFAINFGVFLRFNVCSILNSITTKTMRKYNNRIIII